MLRTIFIVLLLLSQLALGYGYSGVDFNKQQRGAQVFVERCMGCHSLTYFRFQQLGDALGYQAQTLSEKQQSSFFLGIRSDQLYRPVISNLSTLDAERWFNAIPPDLSLITRQHKSHWVYQFLMGFYNDNSALFGTNNYLVPGVKMPNVLSDMSVEQKEIAVVDLVYFLQGVSEPNRAVRYHFGIPVIMFCLILTLILLRLKTTVWRDLEKVEVEIYTKDKPVLK